MEKTVIQKMEDQFVYFGGMSLLYGGVFAFCLYKNVMGVTALCCVVATIIFSLLFLKKIDLVIKKQTGQYFAGMLLLGFANCITVNEFFIFFNWIGTILLLVMALLHQFQKDEEWGFQTYVVRILCLFGRTIVSVIQPFKQTAAYIKTPNGEKKKTVAAVLAGLLMSLVFLAVVLPLLVQSDMIFASYFKTFFRRIHFGTLFGIGGMILLGSVLCYSFFRALCVQKAPEEKESKENRVNAVIGITFTAVLAVVYVLYCGIQIWNLFMGMQKGLPEGITYSQYAHAGFWQLLVVSIINFITVLICMQLFRKHNLLKGLLTVLSVCTCIMTISAAYRMILYVQEYQLTFLRILVLWFLAVLALIMCGTIISIYKERFHLFRYIVTVIACSYIALSFARPDTLVAQYNLEHGEYMNENDVRYLLTMSMDAAPIIAQIDMKRVRMENDYGENGEVLELEIYNYFRKIAKENENIYFRKANYSKIRAKLVADEYLSRPLW